MEDTFKATASLVALAIEAAVVVIVSFGALEAIFTVLSRALSRQSPPRWRREVWLRFASWILLSLEFALGADIIRTAIAPTWNDIGKLAAIATIRTALNYFLEKDIEPLTLREPDRSQG